MDRRELGLGLIVALCGTSALAVEASSEQGVNVGQGYHPDDHDWIGNSRPADDLAPCFRFLLRENVYVGDPNDGSKFNDPAYNPRIALPEFPRQQQLRPASSEIIGHEEQLADYYRRVGALAPPHAGSPNYWLRLSLESSATGTEIGFPWWDRVREAAAFFRWLKEGPSGTGFLDTDQGWMFRAFRAEERFYFLDSDPDDGDRERVNVSVDRPAFIERVAEAERLTRVVIERLKLRLRMDHWS